MSFGGNVEDKDVNLQYHKIGKKPLCHDQKMNSMLLYSRTMGSFCPQVGGYYEWEVYFSHLIII
jgi:hypothetical protein